MNRILITGVAGVGKSEISKQLSLILGHFVINDKLFSITHKTGYYKKEGAQKEYVVNIEKFENSFSLFLKKNKKSFIFEGHLWCELSKHNLKKFDVVIILELNKKTLEKRLRERKYSEIKILDNIFAQENKYIEKLFVEKGIAYKNIKITSNLNKNILKIKSVLKNG